jgi:hypothetical protein
MERLNTLKRKTEATSYVEVVKHALRLYEALIEETEGENGSWCATPPAWSRPTGCSCRQRGAPIPDQEDREWQRLDKWLWCARFMRQRSDCARVAALLDPDASVPDVTNGMVQAALATVAVPTKRGRGAMTETDRMVTAGWGHAGKGGNGIVVPCNSPLDCRSRFIERHAPAG